MKKFLVVLALCVGVAGGFLLDHYISVVQGQGKAGEGFAAGAPWAAASGSDNPAIKTAEVSKLATFLWHSSFGNPPGFGTSARRCRLLKR